MRGSAAIFFLILGFAASLNAEESHLRHREVRYVMGTLLDITLYHPDAKEARRLLDEAFSLAHKLDELLSNYKPESEINRLNQKSGEGRVRVTPELSDFLALAKELWRKTDRVFDISVGPLIKLWQEAEEKGDPPSLGTLKAALALVGMHEVTLYGGFEVELGQKGMALDTGGIGKGYAVDQITTLFKRAGVRRALINFGRSSIYALGAPPDNPAWKLLLQFPEQSPWGIVELKDQALSASDAFGSSFEIRGKRYGHIIDPATGIPLVQRMRTAVLTSSAAEGEALSKYVTLRNWKKEDQNGWQKAGVLRRVGEGEIRCSENFPLLSGISGCGTF